MKTTLLLILYMFLVFSSLILLYSSPTILHAVLYSICATCWITNLILFIRDI
nr:MAG TPA: hypothetical protein [Caudoviricetes sp.]